MTRRWRGAGAAAGVVVALALTGCGGGDARTTDEPSHSSSNPALEDPPFRPLETAEPAASDPGPLTGPPTLADVRDRANAGPSRTEGEDFALVAAQLLQDVRPGYSGDRVVAALASEELPADTRAYLVDDVDGQLEVGTRRTWSTTSDVWIRSHAEDARVSVELVARVGSDAYDRWFWYRLGLDVAFHDGRWWMTGYRGASMGPDAPRPADLLTGAGWRRIPPA